MNCAFWNLPKLLCCGLGWTVQQQRRHVRALPRALQAPPKRSGTNAEWRQNRVAALPLHAHGLTQMVTRKVAQTLRSLPYMPVMAQISAPDCCYLGICCCLLPMLRMQCLPPHEKPQPVGSPRPAAGCRPHAVVCSSACTAAAHGVCTKLCKRCCCQFPLLPAPQLCLDHNIISLTLLPSTLPAQNLPPIKVR